MQGNIPSLFRKQLMMNIKQMNKNIKEMKRDKNRVSLS